MITFTRLLARQLRAVLRRCVRKPYGPLPPRIEFQAGPEGLRLRLTRQEFAIEYLHLGVFSDDVVSLPLEALADGEGRSQESVTLEASGDHKVLARWTDAGVPRAIEYDTPNKDKPAEFPVLPVRLTRNPPGLLVALDEAVQTAATEGGRFAMQRLQLRGRSGEVVATDGKQLLLQGGFTFPWTEDVLIPRLPIFGCKDLGDGPPIDIGKSEHHVVLRSGPWTIHLPIDTDARYPDVGLVLPRRTEGATCWRLAAEDAEFLAHTLPRLPGQDDQPLAVDLNGQVCVRARAEGQTRMTEVVLSRSAYTGKPVRFCVNRRQLTRVLRLGFAAMRLVNADAPLLSADARRQFVCRPLGKDCTLGPGDDALRLVSADRPAVSRPASPERRSVAVSTPLTNGTGNSHAARLRKPSTTLEGHGAVQPLASNTGTGLGALVTEAQALKEALRDAYGRSSRLVAALRRHRQHSKLLASTLASLRQLQHIDGQRVR